MSLNPEAPIRAEAETRTTSSTTPSLAPIQSATVFTRSESIVQHSQGFKAKKLPVSFGTSASRYLINCCGPNISSRSKPRSVSDTMEGLPMSKYF